MDPSRRANKYASNRKQELQLQSELKAIRNKALFDRYVKQYRGEAGSPVHKERGDGQTLHTPKPPSQPKPSTSSNSTRKRVKLNQPQTKESVPSTGGLLVSTGPVCKPLVSKLDTKNSQKPLISTAAQPDKKLSPQKVVMDTSTNVKFAITSSLKTSVPVRHAQSIAPKKQPPAKKKQTELKNEKTVKTQSIVEPKSRPISQPLTSQSQASETSYQRHIMESHTDYANMDSSVTNTPFATNRHTPAAIMGGETSIGAQGVWSYSPQGDSIAGKSNQGSSANLSMSFGSQDNLESDYSYPNIERYSSADAQYQQPDASYDTPETQTSTTRVSRAPSGTLMLEIDMRFKSREGRISELSEEQPHKDSLDSSFRSGTTVDQSVASLRSANSVRSTGIVSESKSHVSRESFSRSSFVNTSSNHSNTSSKRDWSVSDKNGKEIDDQSTQEHSQISSVHGQGDFVPHSRGSTINIAPPDSQVLQCDSDIVGVQSEVTIPECDRPASMPSSAHSAPTLDSWEDDRHSSQRKSLISASSESSTLKASEDKGSMFFSVRGSLSSFGIPFSMQSQSHSLADTSSRDLTVSSSNDHTPNSSFKSGSQSDNDRETSPPNSLPTINPYLLSSSDQHLATSSWLKTIDGDMDFGSKSDVSFRDESKDSIDEVRNQDDSQIDVHSQNSKISISDAEFQSEVFKQVDILDKGLPEVVPKQGPSLTELASGATRVSISPKEDSSTNYLESFVTLVSQKDTNDREEAPLITVNPSLESTAKIMVEEGGIPQEGLPEFLAYSQSPVTLEDVLNITGTRLPGQPRPVALSKGAPITADGEKRESTNTRLTFLSTWDSGVSNTTSTHASIHHFCTAPLRPQLPLPVQILSRQTHTKGNIPTQAGHDQEQDERKTTDNDDTFEKLNLSTLPPPNTPRSQVSSRPITEREQNTPNKMGFVRHPQLQTLSESTQTRSFHSGSQQKPLDSDVIVQHRLQKELNNAGSVISQEVQTSKLPVVTKRVQEIHLNLPGDVSTREVDGEDLVVTGASMQVAKNPANLLWTPAPPKLSLHPSTIQLHLFPQYKAAPLSTTASTSGYIPFVRSNQVQKEDTDSKETEGKELDLWRLRLLDPAFRSVPNFSSLRQELTTKQTETPSTDKEAGESTGTERLSIISEDGQSIESTIPADDSKQECIVLDKSSRHYSIGGYPAKSVDKPEYDASEVMDSKTKSEDTVKHTQSLPQLIPTGDGPKPETETASKDFNSLMKEIESQKEQLIQYHQELRAPKEDTFPETDELGEVEDTLEESMFATSGAFTSRKLQRQFMRGTKRATSKGGGTAGRIRAIRRTKSAQLRAEKAREVLSQPPRKLKRRGSHPLFNEELIKITQHTDKQYHDPSRRNSLPLLTDQRFTALMASQGESPEREDPYKWACDVWWDRWFPEVLKECREAVAELYSGRSTTATAAKRRPLSTASRQRSPSEVSEPKELEEDWKNMILELENIGPLSAQALSSEIIETYDSEVSSLSQAIALCKDPGMLAVHYCRRGAVFRKLGKLKESLSNLDHALSLQSTLSDAYWHRHLLFLLQGNEKRALDDLSLLLKQNKKHFGAFRAKAKLLEKKGDLSSAVYHMTQAIALQPNDPDSYFLRAELYEKRGEVESALSDYARVSELDPNNIEALSRPAMHKFNKGMWAASTQHFAALLQRDPNNTEARIHRAKAHYNIGQYLEALQDLSAAIHLNPNGSQAFYHRACLLRNSQPKQALKDFSVSLLLDDSVANVHTFIHRGILYSQLKSYEEALSDFESAVRLKRTLPSPHVCAGLVHMLHRKNITRAIRCFSAAIYVDPTCIRAYLCRAEAYQRDAKYKLAILDYTRAIHLEPNNPTYYLYKGELFLHLRQLDLASLHIRIAAKLSTGFDQNKTQRALVDSFLGNHQQAITLLRGLPKTPEIYSLLGKIQFKAKDFSSSADSLKQAILLAERAVKPSHLVTHVDSRGDIDTTSSRKAVDSKTKTGFHFICGQSLVESGSLKEAVNEFTKVLHTVPSHDMAYYERGVAKLMDGNVKGVLDLNKSLALNSKLFQSFLARAAFYGKTGRFSKAILNCNEAIRLEPASVRAYLCRGALKYHTKMYSSAIADFSTAIRLDPRHASLAHFNRALCYQATGKLQTALSDYSIVFLLVESPGFKVLVNRALLYLELGDWANGLLDFIMAGMMVKNDPAIFQAIGYCYHRLGSIDSAIEAYTEAISFDSSFLGAYVGRGNAYMDYLTEAGNSKSKLDYLHTLELDPSYLPARVNLAFLLQAEGKFQEAWNELTVALQKDEWYLSAREARAIISLQMGNLFGALLDINAAIQVCKSALLLTNRGVIHQFMGDIVSAMKDYLEAVKVEPGYALAHFNIGNILFQQRHFRQAVDSYTKALSDSGNVDSVLLNRAIAHVMLKETELALDDFNKAIQVNPYSAHAYFNRANLYRSQGEYSKAEHDYKQALDLQPEDWLTMYYYGESLGKLNRKDSAHNLVTKAVETQITI